MSAFGVKADVGSPLIDHKLSITNFINECSSHADLCCFVASVSYDASIQLFFVGRITIPSISGVGQMTMLGNGDFETYISACNISPAAFPS